MNTFNKNKLFIAVLLYGFTLSINAETFTIRNNEICSSKTNYRILSSKTKIKINKSNYSYDETGSHIETGSLINNASKKINLVNNNGKVQIVITNDIVAGKSHTTEYFLEDKIFCSIYPRVNHNSNEKKCFSLPNMNFGVQQLCASNNPPKMSEKDIQKGIATGTITVGGTPMKPIYESNNN